MHTFEIKTKIISGEGSLNYIKTLKAKRVFIVTDLTMKKMGFVDAVTSVLDGMKIEYHVFDSVEANPSLDTVKTGLYRIIEDKPNIIIAIGGGSVIDAAKGIMFFCVKTKEELINEAEIRKPLFIAIPTTSGTGSEVTSFSVITDNKTHTKVALTDPLMLPDVAILDVRFTLSVPPFVTADTGMDVITHALEAYVSTKANTFSDMYAEKALALAFNNLLNSYADGENKTTRQNMHDASCMAGIAFNNAGLGINHSLAHAIGGRFKISHGRTNAILLPHIIAYNSGVLDGKTDEYGHRYDAVAKRLGLNLENVEDRILALIKLINMFNEKMDISPSFKACEVDEKEYMKKIAEMAQSAILDICTSTNPRDVLVLDLEKILERAYG